MKGQDLLIREANNADIESLVHLQCKAMPESLMARCGRQFLKNTFYPVILGAGDVLIYVLEKERQIIGVAVYAIHREFVKKLLSKHKVSLLFSILSQSFRHPFIFLECFRAGTRSQLVEKITIPKNSFHLFLIAVDDTRQGKGCGSFLLQTSIPLAARFYQSSSCVVEARTERAYRFYEQNDFVDAGYETRGKNHFFFLYRQL